VTDVNELDAETNMTTIRYENVRLEIEGPLATLWLDDPDRLNALKPAMVEAIYAALIEISKPRRKIRCLMITGEGRGFCAGANLGSGAGSRIASVASNYHPLVRRIRDLEIPVVAAINGPCVGFGVALALLADHILASDKAFFLVPFATLASGTDSGITWLLPRSVGTARARAMIMRAERLPAEKALAWGMVNEVIPQDEFRAVARERALEYANGPTVALGVMRQLFQQGPERTLDAQLEAEVRGVVRTSRTKDNTIAIMNFGKKEKPVFTGE